MAIVTDGSLLKELRGMLGNELVFKKYGTRTVVAVKAQPRKHTSARQQANCDRFKAASRFAREAMRDPVKRDYYRQLAKKLKKHSGYNVAISEYMLEVKLDVKDVRASSASKHRVVIKATKRDFKVKGVTVRVSAGGVLVDAGCARRVNATDWVYWVAREALAAGCILDVMGEDDLGGKTRRVFGDA